MVVDLPIGGLEVLRLVAANRSPWSGWDALHPANTGEGQEAYRARAETIRGLRQRKLLTDDGLLTDLGEGVLQLADRGRA